MRGSAIGSEAQGKAVEEKTAASGQAVTTAGATGLYDTYDQYLEQESIAIDR